MNLSKISNASRKIMTESGYGIRFLKYLAEVVNFDTSRDVANPWGRPDLYFFNK